MKFSLDSYFALNSLASIAIIAGMIALLLFGITMLLLYLRLRKQLAQTLQTRGEQFHALDNNPWEMVDSISAGMSAEHLRLSTELAGVAVWEFDSTESRLSRTPNHDALYGLEQNNDWRIDRFVEATHPDDRERYQQIIHEAVLPDGPDNYSFDFRVIWPDESIHWLSVRGEVSARDENGYGAIVRGCTIDITEHKHAEDALRESEERYRLLFDNSLDAILLTVPDGDILSANAAASKMFQMTEEEICRSDRHNLVVTTDVRLATYLEERASTQKVFGELTLLRKDGAKFPAELSSALFTDQHGEQLSSIIIRDVSERKEAEERLIASEKRFRALFEQSGDYCLILDPNTADGIPIIVDANEAAWTVHGYTREEFIGRPVADIDDYEGKQLVVERTKRIMTGKPFFIETTHVRKDGTTFPVSVHANRIDIEGEPPLIFTTEFDITKRKLAEESLGKSEERLRLTTEMAGVAVWETDIPARKTTRSANHDRLYGLEPQEHWDFDVFMSRVHPDDREWALRNIQESIAPHAPDQSSFDLRVIWPDESIHWLSVRGEVIARDENGYGTMIRGCTIDFTERKQAEDALRESEERYRLIFDNSMDAILLAAPDGRIFSANAAATEMFQMTEEEICQGGRNGIVDMTDGRLQLYLEERASIQKVFAEVTMLRKDGTKFPAELSSGVFTDQHGEHLACVIIRDVSQRKQAEEALRESEERLRLSTEMAGVAVWETDVQARRITRSTNHDQLYGLEPQEHWDFDAFISRVHPEDRERTIRNIQESIEPHNPDQSSFDLRVIWPNESIHWLSFRGEVIARDENGYGTMIRGCIIDITERKKVEESLRESEERLRLSTDMAGVAVWEYHFAGDRMIRTDNHDRLYGVKPQDRWGFEDFLAHIHPDDQERASQVIQEAMGPGSSGFSSLDYRVIWPDGTLHWLALIGEVTERDENGVGVVVRGCLIDITQRKLAEEALRLSEASLREAQEIALLGNWEMDLTMMRLTWSEVNNRIFGVDGHGDRLTFEDFMALIHPDELEAAYEFLDRLKTQGSGEFEYRVVRPDGDIRWVVSEGKAIYDEEGNPVRVFGIAQDITERKLAEEALRLSEATLREAQEIANLGNWELDVATTLINWSDVNDRIYGIETPAEGFTYDWFLGLVHPDDRELVNEFRDALATDGSANVEYRAVRPDGEIRWIAAEGKTTLDESGNPVRMYGVLQDITERKEAEDAIRTSEERFRGLYEQSPIAIQIYNNEGLLVDVNQQALELFGINNIKYILGFNMWTDPNLTPDAIETLQSGKPVAFAGTLDFNNVKAADLFPTTKSGLMHVDMHVTPLTLNDEIAGYLIQMIDETERKQMEERLLQTQKMEAIGQLAGGIAHDFNNILVPIMGYVDLGMRTVDPSENHFSYLQRIRQAADRAAGLTRQILAFSRQQVMEMQVLDLNQVVTSFESFIKRLIGEDVVLHTFLDPALFQVNADAGQIEQVLMNLAINARDAMPSGGKLIIETANVYLDEEYVTKYAGKQTPGHYVMLAMSDTGHGMDEETQQQIFDPFFTTKSQGEGTGLGLSTVFGIIKQHGGNIWVYSELEKGATFKIYLPRIEGDSLLTEEIFSLPDSNNGSETVLVVEDEEMVRQLVCETLAAYGYHVLEAQSPTDALRIVAEQTDIIHLLLTDVIMPEMNGKELYQKIAAIDPHIKVLYMSGYTDNVIVHHGILDKGVNFLQKPFTILDLTEKIRRVLTADKA